MQKIIELDERLSNQIRLDPAKRGWWKLAAFLAHSGDSWFWMIGLVIIWLLGNTEWHAKAGLLGLAVGGLAPLVIAIKFAIHRRRPAGEWGAIYRKTDPHSFPSGHAARCAMLVVLAIGLGPAWFAWLITIWAPLVALARVQTGLHYISDIVAGAAVGLAAGWMLLLMQPLIHALLPFVFY